MTFWVTVNLQRVGYPITFPRCNNCIAMKSHRPCCTGTKGMVTTSLDKTSARSYEPNLKRQSNEWKHPDSPRAKKVRPTQCAVKVMFIMAYGIDGVILHHAVPPRQTVNAAYYCTFMQHHLRPALRRKRRHMMVQNPIILRDNARSHRCCCHGLIAPSAMGDSGTSNRTHPISVHAIFISSPK